MCQLHTPSIRLFKILKLYSAQCGALNFVIFNIFFTTKCPNPWQYTIIPLISYHIQIHYFAFCITCNEKYTSNLCTAWLFRLRFRCWWWTLWTPNTLKSLISQYYEWDTVIWNAMISFPTLPANLFSSATLLPLYKRSQTQLHVSIYVSRP